jgi:uncharacterized OsmC-like protein
VHYDHAAEPACFTELSGLTPQLVTAEVIYEGNLSTVAKHLQSGTAIHTDAPVDNGGQGAAFSPTDLVAAALASCMCTIMALSAKAHDIQLGRVSCDVEKIMTTNPRRIGEIRVDLKFDASVTYDEKAKATLERAALTCPVFESLHPDCKKTVSFVWP